MGGASAHCSEEKPNIRRNRYHINITGLVSAFECVYSCLCLAPRPFSYRRMGESHVMEAANLFEQRIPKELRTKVKGVRFPGRKVYELGSQGRLRPGHNDVGKVSQGNFVGMRDKQMY